MDTASGRGRQVDVVVTDPGALDEAHPGGQRQQAGADRTVHDQQHLGVARPPRELFVPEVSATTSRSVGSALRTACRRGLVRGSATSSPAMKGKHLQRPAPAPAGNRQARAEYSAGGRRPGHGPERPDPPPNSPRPFPAWLDPQ